MLQLFTCKPYESYNTLRPLNFKEDGFVSASLVMDLGFAYELSLEITPALNAWNELVNQDNIGIRMITDDLDLVFIKDRQPTKFSSSGVTSLGFVSSVYRLKGNIERVAKRSETYSGDMQAILATVSQEVDFSPISSPTTITLDTGTGDNFQLLNDIIDSAGGYNWREVSTDGTKTIIQYGDFRESSDIVKGSETADTEDADIILLDCTRNDSGTLLTSINVAGGVSGVNGEYKSFLTETGESYLKQGFSLQPLTGSDRFTAEGRQKYKIQNDNAQTDILLEDSLSVSISLPSNETVNERDIRKQIYNAGVAKLRGSTNKTSYVFAIQPTKIILPGIQMLVPFYQKQIEVDGKVQTLFSIQNETFFLRKLVYNDLSIYA